MPSDDDKLRDLKRQGMKIYYEQVKKTAEGILKDLPKDYSEDDLEEALHEAADSMVTYTADALDILYYSENWLAGEDQMGNLDEVIGDAEDLATALPRIAYFAVEADLRDEIEQLEK